MGEPDSDSAPLYVCLRIRDAAADYDAYDDAELDSLMAAVRFHVADLGVHDLVELVGLMAEQLSMQFVRPTRDSRSSDDRQMADEAIRGIFRAAQNADDIDTLNAAFKMHTDPLSRRQLVLAAAGLGVHLAALYSADPFTESGQRAAEEIEAWLRSE